MCSWLGQKLYSLLFLSFFNIPYPIHQQTLWHSLWNIFRINSYCLHSYHPFPTSSSVLRLLWKPTPLFACFHPCLPTVSSQCSSHRESLKILYHIPSLHRHSKGFPFHSEAESKVLSMVHGYIRLSIICLCTDPAICLTSADTASLPHSADTSFLAISYLHQAQSCLRALSLPRMFFLDIHTAGSLAFFRSLHRCLSLTTVSKRDVSSFPTILLSFTLLLSLSSFLSLIYIFFFII